MRVEAFVGAGWPLSLRTATSTQAGAAAGAAIPLDQTPPMKIVLLVEPTPFNYVSGYANRFKEMLKYLKEAGDEVHHHSHHDHMQITVYITTETGTSYLRRQ